MDPVTVMQLVNIGLALARGGVGIWGEIQNIKVAQAADGSQTVELIIGTRPERLAAWLAQAQSDQAQTVAEIARRKALP